VKLTQSIM